MEYSTKHAKLLEAQITRKRVHNNYDTAFVSMSVSADQTWSAILTLYFRLCMKIITMSVI